jgi:hypothetical protein
MTGIRDLEVWRSAQQIIDQYPEEPELVACQRADEAWEAADISNFALWMRIAKAVQELVRTKPHVRKAIN